MVKDLPLFIPRNILPIGGIGVALSFPELSKLGIIDPFLARKLTHLVCGIMVMSIEYDIVTCGIMVLIAIGFNCLIMIKPPVFAKRGDLGIIGFGIVILLYAIFQLPPIYLSSLFIADPIGALIGHNIGQRKIFRNKTWLGSITFFLTSLLLTRQFEPNPLVLVIVVLSHTLVETFCPADNIFLGIVGTMHCLYGKYGGNSLIPQSQL